ASDASYRPLAGSLARPHPPSTRTKLRVVGLLRDSQFPVDPHAPHGAPRRVARALLRYMAVRKEARLGYRNAFFQARISANTPTRSPSSRPACAEAAARIVVSPVRKNGLVASSSPIVDGNVGCPRARCAWAVISRSRSAALPGSTASAKRRFASVYSCPQ